MRCWLIIYKKDARLSRYESKMKQIPTYVQVMVSIRKTSVEHEVVIIICKNLSMMYKTWMLNDLGFSLYAAPLHITLVAISR